MKRPKGTRPLDLPGQTPGEGGRRSRIIPGTKPGEWLELVETLSPRDLWLYVAEIRLDRDAIILLCRFLLYWLKMGRLPPPDSIPDDEP